jgi:hypothetical protein
VNLPLPSEVIPMEMMSAFTHVAWASHFDLIEFPRPRQQPPILWPLSFSHRHALLEGELRVMHLIDPSAFLGGGDGLEEPRAVEILDRDGGLGVLVRYAGQEAELTPRFIEDILLVFITSETLELKHWPSSRKSWTTKSWTTQRLARRRAAQE